MRMDPGGGRDPEEDPGHLGETVSLQGVLEHLGQELEEGAVERERSGPP